MLFQLVSARYERGSLILTSNKAFQEWGSVFGDEVIAIALLDCLLHHANVVNIRGSWYRLRERLADLGPEAGTALAAPPTRRRGRPPRVVSPEGR